MNFIQQLPDYDLPSLSVLDDAFALSVQYWYLIVWAALVVSHIMYDISLIQNGEDIVIHKFKKMKEYKLYHILLFVLLSPVFLIELAAYGVFLAFMAIYKAIRAVMSITVYSKEDS